MFSSTEEQCLEWKSNLYQDMTWKMMSLEPLTFPQVVVRGSSGCFFEPGLNRSFDMTDILHSHFGGYNDTNGRNAPLSISMRLVQPHCIFTCYWGIDSTPVVVGVSVVRMIGS